MHTAEVKKKKFIIAQYNLGMQHYTTKMFQHDYNVILYNSSSINKKLKLSDLHFRNNIDCFDFLDENSSNQSHGRTVLCLRATQRCFVTE